MAKNVLINHPDGSGGWHEIHPVTKSTNVFDADGKSIEQKFTDHFSEVATATKSGHMTATDKKKLDGVEAGANKYVHPATHPATVITEDATHRFVTDVEKSNWNSKETTTGAQAKVNVLAGPGNTKTVKQLDTEVATVKDEVATHLADGKAHGIGDKTLLKTTDKSSIVAAVNEAFTSASNGKSAVSAAITGVDPTVFIPTNPTFPDLASAIGRISTGKKWASGNVQQTYSPTEMHVTGLNFRPSVIITKRDDNSAYSHEQISVYVDKTRYPGMDVDLYVAKASNVPHNVTTGPDYFLIKKIGSSSSDFAMYRWIAFE